MSINRALSPRAEYCTALRKSEDVWNMFKAKAKCRPFFHSTNISHARRCARFWEHKSENTILALIEHTICILLVYLITNLSPGDVTHWSEHWPKHQRGTKLLAFYIVIFIFSLSIGYLCNQIKP